MSDKPNLIECSPRVKNIISQNKSIEVRCNAVMFRNKGNSVCYIDDNLSLYPGENFSVGSEYFLMKVIWTPKFMFERIPGTIGELIHRIEVIEFEMKGDLFAHYADQNGLR